MSELALKESDLRILREVQKDASMPLKELAERVAMSQSSLWRRLKDLEAAGIICGRVTLVDPVKAGLNVCVLVHVRMADHSSTSRGNFEDFATRTPAILHCYAVTGAHDYALVVRTRSVPDYEDFLMNALLAHPSVSAAESQLVLRQHKDSNYLPV